MPALRLQEASEAPSLQGLCVLPMNFFSSAIRWLMSWEARTEGRLYPLIPKYARDFCLISTFLLHPRLPGYALSSLKSFQ